jgi:signal transduction histidine kinase
MLQVSINELRNVIALSDLSDELLQWILDRSTYIEYEDGAQMTKTGTPIEEMWIMLEGRMSFYMDVNGKLVHYFNFENDVQTGGIGGVLPYSRMKTSPGYAFAVGKVRGLWLHKKYFPELEQLNPSFIQRLIGYMTERARSFATTQLQHEKVSALGKLSAGIAHELNNPASAISRISSELKKRLVSNYDLTDKLLDHCLTASQINHIRKMVEEKSSQQATVKKLSAMQRIDAEDEISDWLSDNGFSGNMHASETFIDAGFNTDDFDLIKTQVGEKAFVNVLQWLENLLSFEKIIHDMEDASSRISRLVSAIKSHVHMDRTNDMQPTNVNEDIDNTLTLLGYKLREKNIKVTKKYNESLQRVNAFVGELNQVWTNLIDNAIYAMDKDGELYIETCEDATYFKVKIVDNGIGIPADIKSRIFDPFFTTKKVGDGTGIGLDLVNRIIKRHNGEIKVSSVPGRTEFIICIPKTQVKTEVKPIMQ